MAASAVTSPPSPALWPQSLGQPAPPPAPFPPEVGAGPAMAACPQALPLAVSTGPWLSPVGAGKGWPVRNRCLSLRHQLRWRTRVLRELVRAPAVHTVGALSSSHLLSMREVACAGLALAWKPRFLGTAAGSQVPATAPPRASVSSSARGAGKEGLGPFRLPSGPTLAKPGGERVAGLAGVPAQAPCPSHRKWA